MDRIFKNLDTFFQFLKRTREAFPLPPGCAPVNMAKYASIFLICLNIHEKGCINFSDHATALNIHDHLIFLTGFLRCSRF